MRLAIKTYKTGDTFFVETNDDGSQIIHALGGTRKVGERLSAFVEALCDDTPEGADRLLKSLSLLTQEVEKRQADFAKCGKKSRPLSAPPRKSE
jgi:hypothetical protein